VPRGLRTGLRHARGVEPEDGRHRPDARRNGLLHRLRTKTHQWHRIAKRERAGSNQGRVFAQAVPCQHLRHRASRFLPGAPDRDSRGQHQRLRIHRLIEFGLGAVGDERPQVLPEHLRRLVEGGADRRMCVEARHHSDGLRPLSGEDECDLHDLTMSGKRSPT
jgi:hypothetical protein